jgi:hypothetical protein
MTKENLIIRYCVKKKMKNDKEMIVETTSASPKWWRGLPSLLMIMIIANIDVFILNDFIVHRYTIKYQINFTSSEKSREICLNESHSSPSIFSTTTPSLSNLVQSATARLNVYIYLAATLPAIITSMILGSNCDRTGRKSLIALPFIGKTLRYILLTVVAT